MGDGNCVMIEGVVRDIEDYGKDICFGLHFMRKGKPRSIKCTSKPAMFQAWGIKEKQPCRCFGSLDEVNGEMGLHLTGYEVE